MIAALGVLASEVLDLDFAVIFRAVVIVVESPFSVVVPHPPCASAPPRRPDQDMNHNKRVKRDGNCGGGAGKCTFPSLHVSRYLRDKPVVGTVIGR
jgi:hypothetical protein